MKKLLFLFLLLIAGFSMAEISAQITEVTIGTGTNETYSAPIDNFYWHSWTETIYSADDYTTAGGTAGTITSLAFNVSSAASFAVTDIKIYLGTTSRTSHSSSSDWQAMNDLTLVYSRSNVSIGAQTGWETYVLDNPFQYDPDIDSSLVVVVSKKAANGYESSLKYYYTSTSNAYLYRQSDSNTDYANHPGSNTGSTSSYRANIKLTVQTAPITCPKPSDLVISNTQSSETTLSWTPGGTETAWDLYLTTSATQPDSNTVPTASSVDTFYTFTGLEPNTFYKAYVRADCGGGDYSMWRGIDFRTECSGITGVPSVEDFEMDGTGTGSFPKCWKVISNTTSGRPYIYTTNHTSGSNSLYINNSNSDYAYLILPELDAAYNMNQVMVSFDYARMVNNTNARLIVGVMSDDSTITSFEPVDTILPSNCYYINKAEVYFDNYAGTGRHIAILSDGRNMATNNTFFIDYFEVKPNTACQRPANLRITDVTPSSVTIEWDNLASSWEIAVDTNGYDVDSTQISFITAGSSPYTVQNLATDTEYDLYIRGVCGSETTAWSDVLRFKTTCGEHTTLPIVYTFDADQGGDRPSCMTTMSHSYYNVPMVTSFTGDTNKFVYFITKNNNSQYAVMSPIASAISLSDLQMVFQGQTNSIGQKIEVGVMTNPYDESTFELVDVFEPSQTNTWEEHTTFFSGYAGTGQHIAFKYSNPTSSDYRFFVDTVVVDNIATCFIPRNITVSNISGSSAYITWDAGLQPLQTSYTLEYALHNSGQWTAVTVNDNHYLLTGLTERTSYDVRVKSNCAQSNSDYTYNTFSTTCNAGGDIVVGNGTSTTQYFPLYNYYNYSMSEQLFTSAELGGQATNIQSISFQCSTATAASRAWTIYLKPTTATSLSGFVNVDSTTTKVFEGTANISEGWFTIPFDTVFNYNGTSNLILIMHDHTGSYDVSGNYYYAHSNPNGYSYYVYNDGTDYTPTSAASLSTSSSSYRSNVIFGGDCDLTATCTKPNVVVNNVTDESAEVMIVASGSETSWNAEYMSAGNTGWTSLGTITASDLPIILNNLASNTEYTVRAQANCSSSQSSEWKEASFTTECTLISQLPYTENFDGYTISGSGAYPDCWHILSNYTSTKYPYISTTSPASGSRCLYFYNTGTYYSAGILPTIDDSQIQINQTMLSLKLKKTSNNYSLKVGVMSDPTNISTFEEVVTLTPSATGNWEQFFVPFGNYTGAGTYIALVSNNEFGSASYMYVDDVVLDVLPNCMIPVSLTATDITPATISLSWDGGTATNFEVVAVPSGSSLADEIANGNVIMAFEDSLTLTGLSNGTPYTIYVRTDCSVDYSDWATLAVQTTNIPGTLPYFCDFESPISGFDFVNSAATNQWYVGTATNNGGSHALYISNNNGTSNTYTITTTSNAWAYRDLLFPACPNGYLFSFDWKADGESGYDYMMVFVGDATTPSGLNQPAGTTVMQPNVNSSHPTWFNTTSSYQTFTCTIPGSSTDKLMRLYFLWHNDGTAGTQPPASVDNISVSPIYCQAPTNLAVSNITANGAQITWTTPASITNSILYYRADGDTSWNVENTATSPFTLSGLNHSTGYTVRVASDCGDGHNSTFATTSFVTSCLPVTTLPYVQNFDDVAGTTSTSTNVLPICWSRLNGGSSYSGLPTVYNSTSYAHSGNNSLYFYTYTSSAYENQYAILPELDPTIAINTLQLSMSARSNSTSYPFVIQVGVMTDPANDSTFQLVQTLTVTGTNYQHTEAYFNAFTGTGNFIAIKVPKPASNYNYGYVDDIVLDVAPQCSPVLDLTVSDVAGSSALLSWNDGHFGTPASYLVEYSEAGQNNWTPVAGSVTASPYMLSGLDQSTAYDVRVRVNCSDNSESPWATASFTTGCLAGGDITIGNGSTTNSYLPYYGTYNYTYSQQIYDATELNIGAGNISSISFYCTSTPTSTTTGDIRIWLGNTTKSTFNTEHDYISPDSLTQVCYVSGNRPITQGWNTFYFTQPFTYDGTSNLVVAYYEGYDTWSSSSFWVHSTNDHKSILHYSDTYSSVSYTTPATASGSTYFDNYRSDIILGAPCDSTVTCVAPNLYVTNVTSSSATVNWVPGYDETAWEMEYKENTDTIWTPVTISTTFAEVLTSLTPATAYNVRLRSDCGGDYSNWVSANFTTECDVFPIPFSQNFNNQGSGNNAYPMCWSRDNNYSTSEYPYISTTDGGTLYFYASNSTYNLAVTPELNASLNTLAVNFKLRSGNLNNGIIVGVMDSPDSLDGFVPVDTVFCSVTGMLQPKVVYLDSYTGNGHYVAFKTYMTTSSNLYMDDVVIDLLPMCKVPDNVIISNATSTSVDLTWTERGSATSWDVEYGPAGFVQGTGTQVTVTTNPTTITGLNSGTVYDFYVRSSCSTTETSDWTSFVRGSTSCGSVTALPYTENFDSYGTGESAYPLCWDKINTYTSGNRPYCHSTYAYSGAAGLYFYSSSTTYNIAVTPEFDATIAINTLKANFMFRGYSSSYATALVVGVMTSPTDATTFTPVDTVFPGSDYTTWVSREVSFANYTGNGHYIAFKNGDMGASTSCYAMMDNLVISLDSTLAPGCDAPTNVTASNIAQTSATITWTAGGTETSWNLQYKEVSSSNWSSSVAVTGTPSHNLNSLTPNTQYEVRVQAVCDATHSSDWSVVGSFTTLEQGQETCPSPTNVTASDITENSAVISWTQPDNTASSWDVLYKESAASAWNTATTSNNPYTLTGLSAQTSYDVQIIAHCTNGLTSDPSATYTFTTREVGITDYEMATSLYPNPNNGLFTITNTRYNMDNVKVYDAYGKLLKNVEVNGNSAVIDVTDLAAGVYFVRVNTEKGIVTKRVVKN